MNTNCIIEFIENSDLNYKIFLNESDLNNSIKTSFMYVEIELLKNSQNLYFQCFLLENYSWFKIYLIKNMKITNQINNIFDKNRHDYASGFKLKNMNSCFKKILMLLKLNIYFDKYSIQIQSNDSNFDKNNKKQKKNIIYINKYDNINMNKNEEYLNYKKQDIIPVVKYLLIKYKNNYFRAEDSMINKIIQELIELIFLNYKELFYLNELNNYGFQYLFNINDSEHNYIMSIDLIDLIFPNSKKKKNAFSYFIFIFAKY